MRGTTQQPTLKRSWKKKKKRAIFAKSIWILYSISKINFHLFLKSLGTICAISSWFFSLNFGLIRKLLCLFEKKSEVFQIISLFSISLSYINLDLGSIFEIPFLMPLWSLYSKLSVIKIFVYFIVMMPSGDFSALKIDFTKWTLVEAISLWAHKTLCVLFMSGNFGHFRRLALELSFN